MRFVEPTSEQPADELDGLLRTFFRRQMPQPWPAPPRYPATVRPSIVRPSSARTLMRGRWALAAALALLLLGSLLLPSRFTPDSRPQEAINGPASAGRDILPDAPKTRPGKIHENPNKPELRDDGGDPIEMDDGDFSLK